ncbi:MAG: chlorite dismutase family protein [Pseudorhodoplanes sp.]|nr:chlorite dismutase family protein [Pseudorhodoplanes sp.]
MSTPLVVSFSGGSRGTWRITRMETVCGEGMPFAPRLRVEEGEGHLDGTAWVLRGVTSNLRYTTGAERVRLTAASPPLGRTAASRAALIPIRKSAKWWEMAQDQRREIFEEQSRHIAVGLEYVPAVARRLHHCRDLGEPFDFLTWFEYAPEDAPHFEHMVQRMRATEEWRYVEREIDVRLEREAPNGVAVQ